MDDVLIIEHLAAPLKKLLASGNGKCNLGNSNIDYSLYNNPEFAKRIINDYDYKEFFRSINIETKLMGDLAYPVSESAVSVKEALLNAANKLGIKFKLEEKLLDYIVKDKIEVISDKETYVVDKLYFAGGLKSSPKLGSDGSILDILVKHNYQIKTPEAGLSPLYTKEKTKVMDGIRVKANVSLFENNKLIHQEPGEVLFKEHGLSGIVIFNTMSLIARNIEKNHVIYLDLVVYSVPYTDASIFTLEGAVAVRDSVMKANIQGNTPDQYVTTNKRHILPEYKALNVGGKYVGELRGMWRMENGLMAGPFVCHLRLDEMNKRVVFAEGFIYAPKENVQRRFLRNLEASIYTLKLPSDNMMSEIEITLDEQ